MGDFIKKLLKRAGDREKEEAKKSGGGANKKLDLMTEKEMMRELAAYDERKAAEFSTYLDGVDDGAEPITEEELLRQIEGLSETKPHLYASILESFRQEEAMRKKGLRGILGSAPVRYTALILLSLPFFRDLVTMSFTRQTDYYFVIFGVALFLLGPLRKMELSYKLVGIIGLLWLNVNPLYESISEPGLKKYGVQALLFFVLFFALEKAFNLFSGALYGGRRRSGNPYVHGTLAVLTMGFLCFFLYVFFSGEPMTVDGFLAAAKRLVAGARELPATIKSAVGM